MRATSGNLFSKIPRSLPKEVFEDLLKSGAFRLERIISYGHKTAPSEWYNQEKNEWVVLLSGGAGLRFEGESKIRVLHPGDWVNIPAHKRHRVEWTLPRRRTIWLALHYLNPGK